MESTFGWGQGKERDPTKNRSIRVSELRFFNDHYGLSRRDQPFLLAFFSGSAEAFQAFSISPLRTIASSQLFGRLWRL